MLTRAVIIKKQNTNEYDQLVTCYTKDFGKLTAVAKSILKSGSIQALHLDDFNLVEFELINGRGTPIVTGAQIINSFAGIKNSLAKTAIAYFFAEAIDKMVFENDKDEKLWSFLVTFLGELNEKSAASTKLLREGQFKLLNILGYLPEISLCKVCGDDNVDTKSLGAFNYNLGGVICTRCFLSGHGGVLINQEDLNLMRGIFPEFPGTRLLEAKPKPVFRRSVLDGMFEYVSGSKFFSLDLLSVIK